MQRRSGRNLLFILLWIAFGATLGFADPAPIDYWRFNETQGAHVDSIGSNANPLQIQGDVTFSADGKLNGALLFDGESGYLSLPDQSAINIPCLSDATGPDSFTVSAWVMLNDVNRENVLIAKQSRDHRCFVLTASLYGLPKFEVFSDNVNQTYVRSGTPISANVWHHLAASYSYIAHKKSIVKLYLDGVLVGSNHYAVGPLPDNAQDLLIARYHYSASRDSYFDGKIDDLRLFDYALSDAEVSALMTSDDQVADDSLYGSVTLAWDAVVDDQLGGYRIHYGVAPGVYDQTIDVGNVTQAVVDDLPIGYRYYFVASAYPAPEHSETRQASGYSNEVSVAFSKLIERPASSRIINVTIEVNP